MYRSVQDAIAPELLKGTQWLIPAHLLLRVHGKTICRDSQPKCHECPVEDACAFRNPGASKGPRNIPGSA
jgi:endonuclease III